MQPSQIKILTYLKSHGFRYLPKGAVVDDLPIEMFLLGCRWAWSWEIVQNCCTADYRKRISEINDMEGYKIVPFHAPWGEKIRHGYILVAEPSVKSEQRQVGMGG